MKGYTDTATAGFERLAVADQAHLIDLMIAFGGTVADPRPYFTPAQWAARRHLQRQFRDALRQQRVAFGGLHAGPR